MQGWSKILHQKVSTTKTSSEKVGSAATKTKRDDDVQWRCTSITETPRTINPDRQQQTEEITPSDGKRIRSLVWRRNRAVKPPQNQTQQFDDRGDKNDMCEFVRCRVRKKTRQPGVMTPIGLIQPCV